MQNAFFPNYHQRKKPCVEGVQKVCTDCRHMFGMYTMTFKDYGTETYANYEYVETVIPHLEVILKQVLLRIRVERKKNSIYTLRSTLKTTYK